METFSYGLAYRPRVPREKSHRKRISSKALRAGGDFLKTAFSKTPFFYVTVLDTSKCACELPSKMVPLLVTIAFPCGRKKKRLKKCNRWTRIFLTTEKKLSVFIQKLIPAEGTLLQTLLEEKDTYVDLLWLPTY